MTDHPNKSFGAFNEAFEVAGVALKPRTPYSEALYGLFKPM
jgi:hypothetical protein